MATVGRLRDYLGEIAQIDHEIKEKFNFRVCPKSTISLLVSRSDMPHMRCFSIGGLRQQSNTQRLRTSSNSSEYVCRVVSTLF